MPLPKSKKHKEMKVFEILKQIAFCRISKSRDYINLEDCKIIEGELNPRSTYYHTFHKENMSPYEPDAILLTPIGDKIYFFKIER